MFIDENTPRETLIKALDTERGLFDAVLDVLLDRGLSSEDDLTTPEILEIIRDWIEDGDECMAA